MSPAISIVMSVYNSDRFLSEAVQSILGQSFSDFELIIVDDGSTDRTANLLASLSDKRIKFIHNSKNIGLTASLNRAISLAQGSFVARMDADDISLPERLETQYRAFEDNPELDLVACASNFIDEDGTITGKTSGIMHDQYRLWRMQFHNVYIHSSVMFRKSREYIYNENMKSAQDYELWCRIAKTNNTKVLDSQLISYRFSRTQISQLHEHVQTAFAQQICFRNLQSCSPRLSDDECKDIQDLYIRGRLSLQEFKRLPALVNTLFGFFRKYEIPIRDRPVLILFVLKDILYWFRRSCLSYYLEL